MLLRRPLARVRRALKKPPGLVLYRLRTELAIEAQRYLAAGRAVRLDEAALLAGVGAPASLGLEGLWRRLGERPYFARASPVDQSTYDARFPGDRSRIMVAAEAALAHRVDLLGSGPTELGTQIAWSRDFKTGFVWPPCFALRMAYCDPRTPDDVKVPWELSRVQWLFPVGQAYLLAGDERYAEGARGVLEQWIDANPIAYSVNWACTMEVALRILSWTWLFRVFFASRAWDDPTFRLRLLSALYLHGEFTEKFIERSDINGNHFTADAAALVVAGLFFGAGAGPERWAANGWRWLREEFDRQVFPDGVDFEGSVAYHRLVTELFLVPALFRRAHGLEVEPRYWDTLIRMARFVAAYTRPDGQSPLAGDADDARALAFGAQAIGDHRYLVEVIAAAIGDEALRAATAGHGSAEPFWWGSDRGGSTADQGVAAAPPSSAFPDGGFYVLRNERDHVFIDCGPVGLGGRGGHGHNDCLSFEAFLDGVPLVTDSGSYVYTASYADRNRFRATAAHNTPRVGDAEMNRFVSSEDLWFLHDDAKPLVLAWETCREDRALFEGCHSGYARLANPVTPVRTVALDHRRHRLAIRDRFRMAGGALSLEDPLHLSPGVTVAETRARGLVLVCGERRFAVGWRASDGWSVSVDPARVSPSYGVALPNLRLCWRFSGLGPTEILIAISPVDAGATSPDLDAPDLAWAWELLQHE